MHAQPDIGQPGEGFDPAKIIENLQGAQGIDEEQMKKIEEHLQQMNELIEQLRDLMTKMMELHADFMKNWSFPGMGGLGDDDGEQNGMIADPSGLGLTPAESTSTNSGGGGGSGGCFIDSLRFRGN